MLLPLLMNLGMLGAGVQAETDAETGAARYYKKKRKKKGGTVIRRSDFESLRAYEGALRAALKPLPIAAVPLTVAVVEEDDDDEVIMALLEALAE